MSGYEPTERELEILKVLWKRKRATVREVCDAMNQKGSDLAYTSVLSLLQIMERKGVVRHIEEGRAYIYLPRVRKATTMRRLTAGFLTKVFDGALDEFVLRALESRELSASEFDRLQNLIADSQICATETTEQGRMEP